MLRRLNTLLCSVLLLAMLGACAVLDVVDPRYDSVNRSVAKARNEGILLNIVRASHNAPLNFVAFSKVSGLQQATVSAGLPTFNLGQFFPVLNPGSTNLISPPNGQRAYGLSKDTLNGSAQANTNYDISILETTSFYNGLLKPVDLPTVAYFIRQGYSRELLFWTFAEAVRQTSLGQTIEYLNDPDPRLACVTTAGQERCFSDMVDVAIATGLTVETKTEEPGGGSSGGKSGDTKTGGKSDTKSGSDTKKTGSDTKTGGGTGGKAREVARFCFDKVLAERARKQYSPEISRYVLTGNNVPRCGIDPWTANPESDTLVFNFTGTPFGTIKYEIIPRSVYGIYQYLGRILAAQRDQTLKIRGTIFPAEDQRILAVDRAGTGGCLVDTNYEDEYYCIPQHGGQNTKRIMALLAQLLGLNTNVQDLAITPTVRAIQ